MSVAMEDWPRRHRISVDEYHRMAESGLFAPDARVELIDGEIIDMPPMGSPHAGNVSQLDTLLHRAVGDRALIRCQLPIQVGDWSEPQPDLVLVATRESFYKEHHPTEHETLLAIEVSESTLDFDLRRKKALYARQGIREYWVVDVGNHRLHVFRSPAGADYQEASAADRPGTQDISALPGISIDLSSIF